MSYDSLFNLLGTVVIFFPALLLAELGLSALFGRPLSESATSRCTQIAAFALGLAAWKFPGAGGYRPLPPLNIA